MKNMTTDGKILTAVYKNLNVSQLQKESNIKNALKIFNKIPNGYNSVQSNVGLVVGKVQSGKTANIIALTALSFDNNHRLAIMFLSDTNNLLDQNFERIKKSFAGVDDVVVLKKSSDGDFENLDENDIKYLHSQNKRIIICSLKHHSHIKQLTEKIQHTPYSDEYSIIVDDESDDISQNTNKNKFNIENGQLIEKDRSATNNSIVSLKRILPKCAYIAVTATPQANILLQKFQELAPNFCVTIEPGKGYTGLISFHSPEEGKVVEITDFTKNAFSRGMFIPKSLFEALYFFIAGILVRENREEKEFKQSFLIHPSKKIVDHQELFNRLNAVIKTIQYNLQHENSSGNDFFYNVKKEYDFFQTNKKIDIARVRTVMNKIKLHCINGANDMNNLEKRMQIMPYHIIIGGDMIDRGITIQGLTVSYMPRESKIGQVDTLLQRARWFGYKEKYFDVCRVYLTPLLKRQFEEIIEHEASVWEFLDYCSNLDSDIRNENTELIINSSILRPTSGSKVEIEYSKFNFTQTQKSFTLNRDFNLENLKLLRKFENLNGEFLKYNNVQNHKLINITFKELTQILRNFHFSQMSLDNNDDFNAEKLIALCNKFGINEDEKIDLVRMRVNENETRSTVDEETCKITNIMQGRSEGKLEHEEGYYCGDRSIVRENIMIQIHHIKLKNKVKNYYNQGEEIIMLALLFPPKFAMKGIVQRKQISDLSRNYV